jgi:DNA-binding NarL/FixJ family response regulator
MTDRVEPADADSRSPDVPEGVPVLLLDDNLTVLEALKEAVAADETLTVVGTASRICDAIGVAAATHPRVAVIDVNMPNGGGWAAARGLRKICPDIRLVAYSGFGDGLVIRTIAAAGVSAFVTKGSDIAVLLAAIHGRDVKPSPRDPTPLLGRTDAVPS